MSALANAITMYGGDAILCKITLNICLKLIKLLPYFLFEKYI